MKKGSPKKALLSPKRDLSSRMPVFLSDRSMAPKSIKDLVNRAGNASDPHIRQLSPMLPNLFATKSAVIKPMASPRDDKKEANDVRTFKAHMLLPPDTEDGELGVPQELGETLGGRQAVIRPSPVDIPLKASPQMDHQGDTKYIASALHDGRSKVYMLAADTLSVRGVYEGDFADGLPQGKGKAVFEDGSVYEGEWLKGEYHGKGKLVTAMLQYDGDFKDSLFDGQGILSLVNVGVYEGMFLRGRFCGYGVFKWPNGKLYRGHWRDNQMHLKGMMMWPDGRQYIGSFSHGKKEGKGLFYFAGGMFIEAVWRNGKIEKVLQKRSSSRLKTLLTR